MGKLDGKTAIVTGAAMGNGSGAAMTLAKEGARVILTDVQNRVFETADELRKKGYETTAYLMDVSKADEVKDVVNSVIGEFGKIDILVNNAGIIQLAKFVDMKDEIRDRHWNINVNGVWNCSKAVVPYMIRQKYGKIVNISSVTGPMVADAGGTAYAASKAAIWGFTKALAIELAESNITVNAVCPGYILTPMAKQVAEESDESNPESVLGNLAAAIPMKRMGTIEELGDLVAFLASDESRYITGTQVVIDGGSTLPETFGAVGV